jgi:hypothetical protein
VNDVQPRLQLSSAQALYLALDKCSDIVHITDQNLNIQVSMLLYKKPVSFSKCYALALPLETPIKIAASVCASDLR